MTSLPITPARTEATSYPPHPFTVRQDVSGPSTAPGESTGQLAMTEEEARWLVAIGGAVLSAIVGGLCGAALSL